VSIYNEEENFLALNKEERDAVKLQKLVLMTERADIATELFAVNEVKVGVT
jgi:hypothetical protein